MAASGKKKEDAAFKEYVSLMLAKKSSGRTRRASAGGT